MFQDHAVLQRSERTPIWGRAEPGERVSVSFAGLQGETRTGADGRWRVDLNLSSAPAGPLELTIAGANHIVLRDILVGEVWLCSGQSNMEWTVRDSVPEEEVTGNPSSTLRLFNARSPGSTSPQASLLGRPGPPGPQNVWSVDSSGSAAGFSAVAYFFGKKLNRELGVPVGLINASWGGTPIEAWLSGAAMESDPDLREPKNNLLAAVASYPARLDAYRRDYPAWEERYQRRDAPAQDAAALAAPGPTGDGWTPVEFPDPSLAKLLPDGGVVWLRSTVQISKDLAGKPLTIVPGVIAGFDQVYWNGRKVGETTARSEGVANDRVYRIPPELVQAGEATVAIRLFAPAGGAGIDLSSLPQWRSPLHLYDGAWQARVEYRLPPLSPAARAEYPRAPVKPAEMQNVATALFNGVLHPLIPCGIRGAIWYQGETNVGLSHQYRSTLALLIRDWRSQWERGNFPFYLCQLAGQGPKQDRPGPSMWAEIRESQLKTLDQPATGMAVTLDLTENNVHFRRKRPAGERLAAIALAQTYGKDGAFSGPVYDSFQKEGPEIRVKFRHTDGGLVAKELPDVYVPDTANPGKTLPLVQPSPGSELQGFLICGADRNWQWASARIDGGDVVVWSENVPDPVAVRYAWADNPVCNLFNGAGFPASPFRTDDFPGVNDSARYSGKPY